VVFATIFSIIVSFTLTPMLASIIIPDTITKKRRISEAMEKLFARWEDFYRKTLAFVVKNRKTSAVTIAASVVLFFASFFFASQLSFEFFPLMDEGDINIEVELPQGYTLEETAKLVEEAESKVIKYGEVKHVLTQMGKISDLDVGTNLALMKIKLVDAEKRAYTTNQMTAKFIEDISTIPNAMLRVNAVSSVGSGLAPVTFYLQGQNIDSLELFKKELVARIKGTPGMINLNTSSRSGKPEITLIPDRVKLTDAGLTVYDLAMTLRASMEGLTTTRYSDQGEEYDIRITLNDETVNSIEEIDNLMIQSPYGRFTVNQLADVNFTQGFSRILHNEKTKTIEFTAHIAEGYALGDVVGEIEKNIAGLDLPDGYQVKWGGDAELMQESIVDFGTAFILAVLLTYMLLAAILESFTQPLMILGTIPLALIGVFAGLYVMSLPVSIMAMLAIVMLIGIVVNNAILLLDYTNILVKKGKSVKDALLEACPTKLKPILMATLAIMLGMLPMAAGIGSAGREFRQPIGVVSIGGLLISGVMTLYVIPAIYELTHRSKKKAVKGENDE
jgi:HAE1 family hydrophobic/amphiphilic exporter-1